MTEPSPTPGLANITEIDRVVHEPARLMLMATLYVLDSADYTFLMNLTGVTWGNLSAHIAKLEESGYVEVEKSFKGKRPNTMLRLTPQGRAAFQGYRQKMKRLLDDLPE
jgi:DNA-binding MarR family transcriptional regulator